MRSRRKLCHALIIGARLSLLQCLSDEEEIAASSERRLGTPFSLHVSVYIVASCTMQRGVHYGIRYPKPDGNS